MGITIQQWRYKIGCFNQPNKCKNHLNVFVVHVNKRFKLGLRVAICLAAILILCGDVEQNPGPPQSIADGTRKGTPSRAQVTTSTTNDSPTPQQNRSYSQPAPPPQPPPHGPVTRQTQRTILSYTVNAGGRSQLSSSNMVHNQLDDSNGTDIFQYLRSMKEDITNQNSHVTSELSSMNC